MNKVTNILLILAVVLTSAIGFKGLKKQGAYAYISTPAETTIATAGTYYRLEGTFTNEILDDFAIIDGKLTYVGSEPCYFQIITNISVGTDTNNAEISCALFKNGVIQSNSVMTVEVNATTDIQPIPLVDVLCLESGDNIEIRITSDKTGSKHTAVTGNTSAQCFYGCRMN